jgi:hypothetical protein
VLGGDTDDTQVGRNEQALRVEVVELDGSALLVELETEENIEEIDTLGTQPDRVEPPVLSYLILIALTILLAIVAIIAAVRWKAGSQKSTRGNR